ncbi:MAG: hypothetical protein JL55_27510 [Pseudomonas sp. BICA1-14]|nr:MAG: hypothetical protein JL55_27510 [[Pseudomonas] sp. BICA1-14]
MPGFPRCCPAGRPHSGPHRARAAPGAMPRADRDRTRWPAGERMSLRLWELRARAPFRCAQPARCTSTSQP